MELWKQVKDLESLLLRRKIKANTLYLVLHPEQVEKYREFETDPVTGQRSYFGYPIWNTLSILPSGIGLLTRKEIGDFLGE